MPQYLQNQVQNQNSGLSFLKHIEDVETSNQAASQMNESQEQVQKISMKNIKWTREYEPVVKSLI